MLEEEITSSISMLEKIILDFLTNFYIFMFILFPISELQFCYLGFIGIFQNLSR